ncbi:MiAMP1 family antimicrobial peptide [Amycolatopsis sp. NPDC051061]|uniref:MiAMP1 family antimicrobial peptide n=1 Tax=Amycolatopsis sp. NPDC051061 TaxID=3155042 RepID=UPI003421B497
MKKFGIWASGTLAVASMVTTVSPAVAAPATNLAATSIFTAYEKNGYTGKKSLIEGCGEHSISYHGSYEWDARGQSGHLFNQGNPVPVTRLASGTDAEQPGSFGWVKILIVC